MTLLYPPSPLDYLVDERWWKHRGQYPDSNPIREALAIGNFDLTDSWHRPSLAQDDLN